MSESNSDRAWVVNRVLTFKSGCQVIQQCGPIYTEEAAAQRAEREFGSQLQRIASAQVAIPTGPMTQPNFVTLVACLGEIGLVNIQQQIVCIPTEGAVSIVQPKIVVAH